MPRMLHQASTTLSPVGIKGGDDDLNRPILGATEHPAIVLCTAMHLACLEGSPLVQLPVPVCEHAGWTDQQQWPSVVTPISTHSIHPHSAVAPQRCQKNDASC